MTATQSARVLADELPCEVVLPSGTLVRRARAVLTIKGVTVYVEETVGADPIVVFKSRLLTEPEVPPPGTPRRRRRYEVNTEDGQLRINAVAGCLCVYPRLRGYSPETLALDVRGGIIRYAPRT